MAGGRSGQLAYEIFSIRHRFH